MKPSMPTTSQWETFFYILRKIVEAPGLWSDKKRIFHEELKRHGATDDFDLFAMFIVEKKP